MKIANGNSGSRPDFNVKKNVLVIVCATAAILVLPLAGMQFSSEVNWDLADFIVAAALLIGTGLAYVAVARLLRTGQQRLMAAAVFAFVLLTVWAELAVGIFD